MTDDTWRKFVNAAAFPTYDERGVHPPTKQPAEQHVGGNDPKALEKWRAIVDGLNKGD